MKNNSVSLTPLLQLSAFGVFLGRGWQFLLWDAPYRTLFWDESVMGPVVRFFGGSWSGYLESVGSDASVERGVIISGVMLLLAAVAVWLLPFYHKWARPFIVAGMVILTFLFLLYWKGNFFIIAQLMEHTLQWSAPLFLLAVLKEGKLTPNGLLLLKIAVALTFVGHGLFALGVFPIPGHFTVMVVQTLGVSQEQAVQFLFLAGILDMVIGLGIFLPFQFSKWIIAYAIFWGVATTSARIWAHFYIDNLEFVFWRWAPETLFRLPHFLMPLTVFLRLNTPK